MEVRPGYKQTEVGIIPEAWKVSHLRIHLLQDATYGVVKAGTFQRVGIPMLRGGDIKAGSIADDQPLITAEKSREYARTVLKERDVVIALVGYPGESAVVPARLAGANISRAVGLLRPAKTLLPEFLACYLNSPNGRKEFLRPSAGSAQIVVNLGALNQLMLPLPSETEQIAISAALSDVDALLGGLDRVIAKKRDLKQATMQQLLTGQTRLPGFSGEWKLVRLGDHVTFLRNGVNSRAELMPEGDVRYLHYGDVHASNANYMAARNLPFVPSAKAAHLERLRDGDLVFADASEDLEGVSKSVELKGIGESVEVVSGLHTIAARFDKVVLADGFKGLLQHCPAFAAHLRRLAAGTKVYATNRAHVASAEVSLPSPNEQQAIARVVSDMDAELAMLEVRRDKTKNLKKAMMQELLTGKTRLVNGGAHV